MIDSMLMCLSSDLCLCSCIFLGMYWLANGVMPCCRLCRLGHCRVIQTGRSAEGSVHWGILVVGYFGDVYYVYVMFCCTQQCINLWTRFIYQVLCFGLICLCLVVRSQWDCCQARVRIHCEILAPVAPRVPRIRGVTKVVSEPRLTTMTLVICDKGRIDK